MINITNYKAAGLYRQRQPLQAATEINFASNDYLSLRNDQRITTAFMQGVKRYGWSSGASALVSGYLPVHAEFENKMAAFLQRPAALLFPSGYQANLGIIAALSTRHDTIIANKALHISLVEGCRLATGKTFRYRDLAHAEQLAHQDSSNKLLVSESINSMQATINNISGLITLNQQVNGQLIIDDAHGLGVLGRDGRGIQEHLACAAADIDCLIHPLGKAFASSGAIVSGSAELINTLVQFCRSYCYSTAISPALAYAGLTIIEIIQQEYWRRQRLAELSATFNRYVNQAQLPLITQSNLPIKNIAVKSNQHGLYLQHKLRQHNLRIICMRPPTVKTAQIRINLNYAHRHAQLTQLIERLSEYYND